MSLNKIYASKIYLTSSRQDKIHAAMQNPLNLELVQQISAYLDEDSKKELAEAVSSNIAKESKSESQSSSDNSGNVFDGVDTSNLGGGRPSGSSGGSHSSFSAPPAGGDPFGDDFDSVADDIGEGGEPIHPADSNQSPESSASDDTVEESTEITGVNELVSEEDNAPELQSGIIKKLLNDAEDTAGVARVDVNDNDIWIYYNDKINLNDVLDNVISIIKSSGYDMLKFSRLARTDNAVVFDIKE